MHKSLVFPRSAKRNMKSSPAHGNQKARAHTTVGYPRYTSLEIHKLCALFQPSQNSSHALPLESRSVLLIGSRRLDHVLWCERHVAVGYRMIVSLNILHPHHFDFLSLGRENKIVGFPNFRYLQYYTPFNRIISRLEVAEYPRYTSRLEPCLLLNQASFQAKPCQRFSKDVRSYLLMRMT